MFKPEIPISEAEVFPHFTEHIVARFGPNVGSDREEQRKKSRALLANPIYAALFRHNQETFIQKVEPHECPIFRVVSTAAFFVGLRRFDDHTQVDSRVTQVYCGHRVQEEDSVGVFGPLSGRQGTEYTPFSQCWKIGIELARLVEFMESEVRELTELEDQPTELDMLLLLQERSRIRQENEAKREVYSNWIEIKNNIGFTEQRTLLTDENASETPASAPEEKTTVLDGTEQFKLGSTEYRALVTWVKQTLSIPLLRLIGPKNVSIHLKTGPIYFPQDTAEHCKLKPTSAFDGIQS